MKHLSSARRTLFATCAGMLGMLGCGGADSFNPGTLQPSESRPDLASPHGDVDAYRGDDMTVLTAQARLFDGFALHANVIYPTCGPIGGVCHNAKEYPDLHTPANFLSAVGAPCNVQPGSYEAVYDRCEQTGDRLDLGDGRAQLEIAYLEYVPGESGDRDDWPEADAPGLHIYLAGQLNTERNEFWTEAKFERTFVDDEGNVKDLVFFRFQSRFWVISSDDYEFGDGQDGTHILAEVREYQTGQIEELLSVGVRQADMNRNGVLGARGEHNPVSMISPGAPESSYLVARMLGTMGDERIPGSRMPLANEPLDSAEMLALFCFIEGLAEVDGPPDLAAPIDYARCSYSKRTAELELLGSGVSWDGRISKILEFNCGGCHSGTTPAADLNLKDGDVHARLLLASDQRPEFKLVEPGQPDMSYLLHKLEADPSIIGQPMPLDPLEGARRLTPQELSDMRAWIAEGALPGSAEPEAEPEEPVAQPNASDAGVSSEIDAAM